MLTVNEVIEIHGILTDWFEASEDPILPPGVKSIELLESAIGRPTQTVDGKDAYPSAFEKAAALFHSLANNHAFHNGNKRIALVSTQAFLAQGSQWLDYSSDEEMFEFTRKTAAHELTDDRTDEFPYIVEWLKANCRKAIKGEHPLKYGELKDRLAEFGFTIDPPDRELLWVYKGGERVERINKQGINGFRPYHTDYIAGLRKRLDLTPEHGVDSAKFYGHKGVANNASLFIELRIEVMRRLAKI